MKRVIITKEQKDFLLKYFPRIRAAVVRTYGADILYIQIRKGHSPRIFRGRERQLIAAGAERIPFAELLQELRDHTK